MTTKERNRQRQRQLKIGRAVEMAARYMPLGFWLELGVEDGAGWVEVRQGSRVWPDEYPDGEFHEEIIYAIRRARWLAKQQTQPNAG